MIKPIDWPALEDHLLSLGIKIEPHHLMALNRYVNRPRGADTKSQNGQHKNELPVFLASLESMEKIESEAHIDNTLWMESQRIRKALVAQASQTWLSPRLIDMLRRLSIPTSQITSGMEEARRFAHFFPSDIDLAVLNSMTAVLISDTEQQGDLLPEGTSEEGTVRFRQYYISAVGEREETRGLLGTFEVNVELSNNVPIEARRVVFRFTDQFGPIGSTAMSVDLPERTSQTRQIPAGRATARLQIAITPIGTHFRADVSSWGWNIREAQRVVGTPGSPW